MEPTKETRSWGRIATPEEQQEQRIKALEGKVQDMEAKIEELSKILRVHNLWIF